MKNAALSIREVGIQLGLSAKTVRKLIKSGEIPAFKPGKRNLKVLQSSIDDFKARKQRELRHEYDSHFLKEVNK